MLSPWTLFARHRPPLNPPAELTEHEVLRWRFVRWLVWNGRLSDWPEITERARERARCPGRSTTLTGISAG